MNASILQRAVLYGIVDLGYVLPNEVSQVTLELMTGGVDVLQLRAKGTNQDVIQALAEELAPLCKAHSIPFIVNDFPEIAQSVAADGVHIGQEDGTLKEVRNIVGSEMIVGRSTHSVEQAHAALEEGFDYIGFGPLYTTPTKPGRPSIGLEKIQQVEQHVGSQIPVFCIGGIHRKNLSNVIDAGATRAVLVSDLLTAADRTSAASQARVLFNKSLKP